MTRFFDLYLPTGATELDIQRILDENKLVRLHPHWFVEEVEEADREDSALFVSLRDYATDQVFSLGLTLDCGPAADDPPESTPLLRISFLDFGARELFFFVDRQRKKVRLRIRYAREEPEKTLEQDLLLWVRAIQEYLRMYISTTPRTVFFRLLMNRMILQMNPSQRKICLMITKITVVELVVIVVLVVGYVYFGRT